MRRIARVAVSIAAFASLFTVAASATAGAVTWHVAGTASFHATSGPSDLMVPSGSFIACSASTATATSPIGSFATYSFTGTLAYSPCAIAGQSSYVHCGFTFTAVGWTSGAPATTSGLTDLTCVARLTSTNTPLCHLEGSVSSIYTNPSGSAPGKLTLQTSNAVVVTHAAGTNCAILAAPTVGHLSEQTLTLTSGGPIVTRTA